jgi:hypothetical protein
MLKDFIGKQTAFNKSVKEKLGKIDILASKVGSLALDVELLKLKVLPNEVKKAILLPLLMPSKLKLMKMLGC